MYLEMGDNEMRGLIVRFKYTKYSYFCKIAYIVQK